MPDTEQDPSICPLNGFYFPTDEELAASRDALGATNPVLLELLDGAEESEPLLPQPVDMRELVGEVVRVVVPRVALGLGSAAFITYALWG